MFAAFAAPPRIRAHPRAHTPDHASPNRSPPPDELRVTGDGAAPPSSPKSACILAAAGPAAAPPSGSSAENMPAVAPCPAAAYCCGGGLSCETAACATTAGREAVAGRADAGGGSFTLGRCATQFGAIFLRSHARASHNGCACAKHRKQWDVSFVQRSVSVRVTTRTQVPTHSSSPL